MDKIEQALKKNPIYAVILFFMLAIFCVNVFKCDKHNGMQERHGVPDTTMVTSSLIIEVSHVNDDENIYFGSGVVFEKTGKQIYILTCAHLFDQELAKEAYDQTGNTNNAFYIDVAVQKIGEIDFVRQEAKIRSIDYGADLALISVENLPHLSSLLKESTFSTVIPKNGEDVWIVSSPEGQIRSITKGVLSNKNRKVRNTNGNRWQISAQAFRGSSGGAAFDKSGKIIGIVSSIGGKDSNTPLFFMSYIIPNDEIFKFLRDCGFTIFY